MKKTVITCILSMMVLCGVPSFVGAQTYIPVKEMTSQTTSCNPAESTNYYWYLLDDGSYTHPYDNFGVNGGDALIGGGGNGSSIDIWRNNGVLTKCNTWERVSNVVKDGEKVLAFLNTDDCAFNIPNYTKTSNPSAIDAQIHFTIGFRGIGIGSNYPNPMSNTLLYYWPQGGSQYKCYPNGNSVSDANNCAKVSVNYGNNVQSHVGECQNYRLFWCGDGLINSPIGTRYDNGTYTEECDPAAPEWKNGSDGKSCNSSCKIEYEESSCGSLNGTTEYNSNYSSPRITESTSGLCGVGKLVSGSLSYNKTTGKYTWSCQNGSATPVACNAQDLWCGDGTLQSAYEQCDPKDQSQKGWENGTWKTCNSSCKLESIPRTGPVCSSSYNKKTEYTTTSAAWLSTNDKLCDVGTLVSGSLKYSGNPRTFKWSCTNDGLDVDCEAYQQWCGDGVKNGNEVCDPEDITNKTGWGDGCSASCDKATYNPGVCGSKFHKQKTYLPISVDWLTENTQGLCDKGTVINFHKHTSSYVYTWQCNNNGNPSGECRADQEWCGDGIVQGNQGEDCDDGNKNGTSSSSCSATCTKVAGVSCGTKDKGTTYFGAEQKEPWLTTTSAGMCAAGLTVGKPSMVGTHIEWTCSNANGGSITCVAYQDYCGDGELQSSKEECDYNDINETNWGNDGCDTSCKQKNEVVNVCDVENTFHYKLRQGYEYTFWDEFNAKDADRRLFGDPDVTFIEQQDFNRGANPTFKWTNRSSEKKVEKGKTVRIIESTPKYYIQDHPNKRSEDNIYIEYNVQYANSSTAPESRWKIHKECVFYEISRCGDGIIDTDWEGKKADHKAEECDPGSEGTKVLPDGRICNSNCEIEAAPAGQPEIEKTLQDKVPVEKVNQVLKWTVKVTAKGGDVTDFQIQDRLPEALDYVSYKVVSNSDNLTVTGPTGPVKSGSNNIYTWNVKGTLKENHVLTLEVETKVNKMPNSEDDYLNIACVIDDGKIDCDNDEPPVKNGQPEIEKTLQDKVPVENVNQVLKWTVKVTAKGGDVTDFQIQDRLPEALDYVSYKVLSNSDNLTVTGPTGPVKSGSNNIYTWNVKGTLKENHVLTLEVETKVNKMPNSEDDYLNIACVIDDGKIDCDNDEPPVTSGKLNIVKTIVGSKEIKNTGDIITWNVKVTAVDGDVTNFTITDKMPSILGYSGSLVLHNPGLTVGTPIVSGNEVSWRVTGTLEKGEYIEIQLTTYAKVMPDKDYKNVACVKYVDENGKETEKCDDEPLPAPDLWIKKYFLNTDGTVTKETKTVKVNDKLTYKITFGNSGTASATITSIKDFLPKNVDYVSSAIYIVKGNRPYQLSGSEVIDSNRKVDGVYVDIYGGITLAPKTEGYIILTGTVKSEYQNNTTNFACIYLNDKKVDCDDVAHKLTDEVMCKRLDITTSSFGKGGGSTNVSCSTDGGKAKLIELDCGNGTVITGTDLSVLPGTCSYPSNSSSSSKSYPVQCKVNGVTTSDCKGTVTVQGDGGSGGSDPYCMKPSVSGSDRVKTVVCETDNGKSGEIKIDCGYGNQVYTSNGKVKSFTSTCDYSNAGNGTYKIRCRVDNRDIRESECSSEVKYTGGGPSGGGCYDCDKKIEEIYAHPKCFNVNAGNVSIQAGEILPFYRNIEKMNSEKVDMDWFDEKDYGYGDKNTYSNLKDKSCNTTGQIALSSMVCHFSIKDGKGNTQASGSYPCLNKSTASNPAIVNAWIDWQRHVYNDNMDSYDPYKGTNYTFRSNVQTISNFGNNAQYFGEYKISLNEIEYLYCDAETNKWTPGPVANSECTSDFALTNPYTVQKTPSGNLRASTERLSKYLYMNGNSVMSDLLNAISTTEYEANPSVDKAMEDFITKYKKLAVNVGNGLKKVPGKSIYFIEGDRIIKNGQYNKPFTFIQTDPNSNITIEGNVTNLNMMILTEGTITFKDNTNNCNPSQKQTRQTVKGIFYAKGGLKRDGVQMNKSVNEYKRCSEGGLTIKGVLIGKGLQSMMDASRSNLNNWFKDKSANTVMNGASVLIEYSPSVFTKSTMPPGAEDFTTALSIYKQ